LFLDVNLAPIDPRRQQPFLLGREVADAPLADAAIVYVDMSAGMVGPGMTARPHFGGADGSLARLGGQFANVAAGLPGRDRFVKFNLMASTHCEPTSPSRIRRSLSGAFPCRTPWQKSAFARLNPVS
jgi:hypothetical protein